jgi:hypothetical protein
MLNTDRPFLSEDWRGLATNGRLPAFTQDGSTRLPAPCTQYHNHHTRTHPPHHLHVVETPTSSPSTATAPAPTSSQTGPSGITCKRDGFDGERTWAEAHTGVDPIFDEQLIRSLMTSESSRWRLGEMQMRVKRWRRRGNIFTRKLHGRS